MTQQTTAMNIRADEVHVGDHMVVNHWDGSLHIATVQSIDLVGDDIEFTFFQSDEGEMTTSRSNTVSVVRQIR